jgi:signal transduction histidine kinase/CheY-like chemotaxis protein
VPERATERLARRTLPTGVLGRVGICDPDGLLGPAGQWRPAPEFSLRTIDPLNDTGEPCEVIIVPAAKNGWGVEILRRERMRDRDNYRILGLELSAIPETITAINDFTIDAILVLPATAHDLGLLIDKGIEASLMRRHRRSLGDELASRNLELMALSDHLEALVEERTSSLTAAQVRLQEQQQEMIRLETQGVVSQLVRGLAHELNNPLAAILGYAQRLRKNLAGNDDSVRRLDVILQEVDRCRSLVEQLRNLAAPLSEELVPCHPHLIAEQAVETMAMAAGPTAPAPPTLHLRGQFPVVLAAPHTLARVFAQLFDNAVLAGANNCYLSAREDHGRVTIRMENDGATPDDEVVRNAMRPFFTTHASGGHRGLGLAIAGALMREQNGSVVLVRRDGDAPGAAYVLQLQAQVRTLVLSAIGRPAEKAAPILVVDDELMVAELLADALNENGHANIVVGSVAEALAELTRCAPRAMFADVNLPDGSGIDLIRRALAMRPGLSGRIALITGGGEAASRAIAAMGMDIPVLGKPFRLDDVAKLLAKVTGQPTGDGKA